ncbi:MAG: hypothetical protein QM734_11510 [Cyclobacteriaceae bacterium]
MAIITSCSHEETKIAATRNISFSFSQQARNGDKMSESQLPAYVLISINDSQSKVVYENKKLPLFSFGQGYLSENLQLNVGNYKLTKFLVLDASNKIIYATPLEGSELAKYVDAPLPIDFTVTENGTATVTPQVLAVKDTDNPESFGYVNFGFEVASFIKLIAIKDFYLGKVTDSIAFIYDDQMLQQERSYYLFNSSFFYKGSINYFTNRDDELVAQIDSISMGSTFSTDTSRYIYENGQLKKIIFTNASNKVECEYFYQNGLISVITRYLVGQTQILFLTELSFDKLGNVIETRKYKLNQTGTLKQLYLKNEYEHDTKKNPLVFFAGGLYNRWFPDRHVNNIVRKRTTEYINDNISDYQETVFIYTYSVKGLPLTRQAKIVTTTSGGDLPITTEFIYN